jgi:hypothetical protein
MKWQIEGDITYRRAGPRRSWGGRYGRAPKIAAPHPPSSLRPLAAARRRRGAKPSGSRRRRASIPRARGPPAGAARCPGRCAAGGEVGSRSGGLGQASTRTAVEVTVWVVPRPVSLGRVGRAPPRSDLGLGAVDEVWFGSSGGSASGASGAAASPCSSERRRQ